MDFYVIPNLSSLDLMHLGRGNRYYALAHLYVQHEHYRQFFQRVREQEGSFITLDNSAAERALVTEDILIGCVKSLMPDEVIPPDVLFDYKATIDNCDRFIARMWRESLFPHVKIFACPQGRTKSEWLACYTAMLIDRDVETIGLSKIAVPFVHKRSTFSLKN